MFYELNFLMKKMTKKTVDREWSFDDLHGSCTEYSAIATKAFDSTRRTYIG